MKRSINLKALTIAIFSIILVGILFINIKLACCSFFMADDFSNANTIGLYNVSIIQNIAVAFKFSKDTYINWQGTYFSAFLQALLSPLNNGGLSQLRIIMVLNILLIFASVTLYDFSLLKKYDNYRIIKYILAAFSLILLFGFYSWPEIIEWFTGAVNYSIPLSVGLITLALSDNCNKKALRVLWLFLAFISSGGSLAVTGLCAMLFLTKMINAFLSDKSHKSYYLLLFISSLGGALFNSLAPGNYARYNSYGQHTLHLNTAIMKSLYAYIVELTQISKVTPLLLCMIIIVSLSIVISYEKVVNLSEKMKSRYLVEVVLLLSSPFSVIFPVSLGYIDGYIPNRCVFVIWYSFITSYLVAAFLLGIILGQLIKEKMIYSFAVFMTAIAILIQVNYTWDLETSIVASEILNLSDGKYQNYAKDIIELCNYIDTCNQTDVIIDELPQPVDGFLQFSLSDEPNHWINIAIATYYRKNTVTYINNNH